MTTIGYATLQIIPSLKGVSEAVNQQLGGLKGEGRAAGKALGDGLAAGVDAAAAKVEQASKKVEAARNREADAAGKLKTAEAQLQSLRDRGVVDVGRLTAAEEKVEKAKRDHDTTSKNLTRSLKTEETATDRLTAAQKRLSSAADDAGSSVDGLFSKMKGLGSSAGTAGNDAASGFVEGMGGPLAALGTKTGPIGVAILAAVGLGIGAGVLLGQNIMAGVEREVDRDRIQAQLGMTEGEAARFGQSTGEVYANNFGESLTDVGAAMADVSSTFRTTSGDALEGLTEKALTFRDVFGIDVRESVAAAQNLIVNGLAADGTQAFDLLTASFQRVPAAMREELPEILNEYGTNFQSLGYSGEEAFGMLVAAAPRGKIVLDKIGDSLKEFTLLATDLGSKPVQNALKDLGFDGADVANNLLAGGDTAQEQFQQIVDGLLAIPDAGEQAGAAVTLFGTPLEDLDKSKIPQFLGALDQAGVAMDGFAGSSQAMVDTVGGNAASAIETAKRSIETSAMGIQDSLASAFGPELTKLAEWVTANSPAIEGFFLRVAQFAISAVGAVADFAGDFLIAIGQLAGGVGNVLGGILKAGSGLQRLMGDDETADRWLAEAEAMFSWGEGLQENGQKLKDFNDGLGAVNDRLAENAEKAQNAQTNTDLLANSVKTLPDGKTIVLKDNSPEVLQRVQDLGYSVTELPDGQLTIRVDYKDSDGRIIPPDQLRGFNPNEFANAGDAQQARRGGFDSGGYTGNLPLTQIAGVVHGDEHVIKSTSRRRIEADHPGLLDHLNATGRLPGYQDGGLVDMAKQFAVSMDPAQYQMGGFSPNAFDCSAFVSAVANVATGRDPFSSRMSTVTAGSWLKSLGFKTGSGGPGDLRVGWWDKGGGANGHMAGTFPDGTNFESTSGGVRIGGPVGASAKQFTDHAYLPAELTGLSTLGDEPAPAPDGGAGSSAAPSSAADGSGGGGGGGGVGLPSSFSDFGSAIGEFAGGQIGSALDVFGIPDSPGWLQGASQLLGGISVSDSSGNSLFDGGNLFSWGQGGGSSVAPLAATSTIAPALPEVETEHGLRAGQRPGPQTVYNITARDTEDAFIRSQRQERERAAAKLERF